MRFGSLELKSNLFLSPLAGYTNLPFRLTLREIGGLDLATTDLVNARSLLEKNPKAFKLIETCPADRPLAVTIFLALSLADHTDQFHFGATILPKVLLSIPPKNIAAAVYCMASCKCSNQPSSIGYSCALRPSLILGHT